MKNLHKLPRITRLAKKFGTPLIDADVITIPNGIIFTYEVGNDTATHRYSDADRGIAEEIIRLERLLAVEF